MTDDEVARMLAEFRTELAELKALLLKKLDAHEQSNKDILQQVRGLHAKLELLQLPSVRLPTTSLLTDPDSKTDVLALLQLGLPQHLLPVYAVACDHGLVTAEIVSEETNLSPSHAAALLKTLAREYRLLNWRKGDKTKGESTRTYYYFPSEFSPPITPSSASPEEPSDTQT
ncbi:MAG: hypothetical protein ACXAB4_06935 [Candidatus Hodarchaeales archaeon]|jgi:hypothetical protein